MDWDDLKYLLAVARARSFQGAGRLLSVSHTTVSRRIVALEGSLALKLFDRGYSTCVPTEACISLIEPALRIEAEIEKVRSNAEDAQRNPVGHVRVVTTPWIVSYALAPALPTLYAQFPDLRIQLIGEFSNLGDYPAMATVYVRFAMEPTPAQIVTSIATVPYSVYAARGIDPASLEWATFHTALGGYAPSDWLAAQGIGFHQVRTSSTDAAFLHPAIRAGAGKGLLPDWIGGRDPALTRISGPEPAFVRPLKAIADVGVFSLPRVRAVVGWIEAVFADPESAPFSSPV